MLIEFFGLPGAGKSTLSQLVSAQLRAQGIAVDEATYVVDHRCGRALRLAKKATSIVGYAATRPYNMFRELRQILATRQSASRDLSRSISNWMFVASIAAKRRDRNSLVLLDQGFAQAIWTIGFGARQPNWLDLFFANTDLDALMPDAIIRVNASQTVAAHRLAQREGGASRLDGKSIDDGVLNRGEARCEAILARARSNGVRIFEVENNEPSQLSDATTFVVDEIVWMLKRGPAVVSEYQLEVGMTDSGASGLKNVIDRDEGRMI